MSRQPVLIRRDVSGQHMTVRVIAPILRSERNGLVQEGPLESSLPSGLCCGHALSVDPASAVYEEGRQHLHTGIEQGAVGHWMQQLFQRSVDASSAVVFLRPADGNR